MISSCIWTRGRKCYFDFQICKNNHSSWTIPRTKTTSPYDMISMGKKTRTNPHSSPHQLFLRLIIITTLQGGPNMYYMYYMHTYTPQVTSPQTINKIIRIENDKGHSINVCYYTTLHFTPPTLMILYQSSHLLFPSAGCAVNLSPYRPLCCVVSYA